MDPDTVYQKEFDTILLFLVLWKKEAEYQVRYREAEKLLNPPTA